MTYGQQKAKKSIEWRESCIDGNRCCVEIWR